MANVIQLGCRLYAIETVGLTVSTALILNTDSSWLELKISGKQGDKDTTLKALVEMDT